jgi:DNA transposition AAA+ family ATPase
MRNVFARTSNVVRFAEAMARLQKRGKGIPGMALVYGEPGLGKTQTILWFLAQTDAVFIRAKALMTGRWLLADIVAELGEAPMGHSSKLFQQCTTLLIDRPRTLFIDEVDYLTSDGKVVETLRDIYDQTETPIVFVGMANAERALMRFKHLYDRFSEVVRFESLSKDDVRTIANEMCEVALSLDAVEYIHEQGARFRSITRHLYTAEHIARTNSLKEITREHLAAARKSK